MIQSLDVFLWNRKVGTLLNYKERYTDKVSFYFDENYINNGYDLFPLRASIRGNAVKTGLPTYAEKDKSFGGLPSFIADSLPDYWGNKIFAEWAKLKNIKMRDLTSLDRLAYIGSRGMGALEFKPTMAEDLNKPLRIEISDLYEFALTTLREISGRRNKLTEEFIIESMFRVGTSAGGRRPKAIINLNRETNECYSGQVPSPSKEFIPMIIKFDENMKMPTTRIEYSYYLMAKDAGLDMMPSQLISIGDRVHFLTERFDRSGKDKIHVQTLAAMNPLACSYEDLFDVANRLALSSTELRRLFGVMVMNVLVCNVDDHNKNFSFMMNVDGVWRLSPTYDFTFAVDLSAPAYMNRHTMTINGKNYGINRTDVMEIAKRFGIKGAAGIIDNAIDIVSNYKEYACRAGISEVCAENISSEMREVLREFL